MNSVEIIDKVLKLEKTPRVPVALLSGGAWTFNKRGYTLKDVLGNDKLIADVITETSEIVKSDIVWVGSGYHNLVVRSIGGNIKFRKTGVPDVQNPLFTSAGDIDKFDISNIYRDSDLISLWKATQQVSKNIGDKIAVGSSMWGPFTLAGLIYGVENVMRNIYKDQKAVHEVLKFTSELTFRYLERYIDSGAAIISIADPNASGDMISRKQFEDFAAPYIKDIVQRVKQKGANVILHICGNVTNRLDLIPDTGTALQSLDYKVDLKDAREILGSKIAFSGNLNPVAVMRDATPKEVAELSREAIKRSGNTSGYLLMPGCDIPPDVPTENIQAMIDTAHNWIYEENRA